jgi:hypothetical protein
MGLKRSAFILSPLVSASLLWSQAATAAVSPLPAQVDPLVALSALGTAGSASAVCAGAQSTSAAVAAGQAVAAGVPGGCVLPVPEAAVPPPPPEAAPPPPLPVATSAGFNFLPLLLGLAAVVAIAAVIASGHGNGSGNLQPVSPA